MGKLFGVMITDIVELRRRRPIICGNAIDKARYYTGNVIDIGEVAAHLAMLKPIGLPSTIALNRNTAISGRPYGLQMVKNRRPVTGARGGCRNEPSTRWPFGRGVEANGMIGPVIDRNGSLGCCHRPMKTTHKSDDGIRCACSLPER
jgi:hypothetical protein